MTVEKPPFTKLEITCKAAAKSSEHGRFIISGNSRSDIINCYLRAAMNIVIANGYLTRYSTAHSCVFIDNIYRVQYSGTVFVRAFDVPKSALERLVGLIHYQAEIIYNMTDPNDMWRILYDNREPKDILP